MEMCKYRLAQPSSKGELRPLILSIQNHDLKFCLFVRKVPLQPPAPPKPAPATPKTEPAKPIPAAQKP